MPTYTCMGKKDPAQNPLSPGSDPPRIAPHRCVPGSPLKNNPRSWAAVEKQNDFWGQWTKQKDKARILGVAKCDSSQGANFSDQKAKVENNRVA